MTVVGYYDAKSFGSDFLGDILDWVANNMDVEEVYGRDQLLEWVDDQNDVYRENELNDWAEENDYVLIEDVQAGRVEIPGVRLD